MKVTFDAPLTFNFIKVMKAILVTTYSDYETFLVEDDRLNQIDTTKSVPVGGRVDLGFRPAHQNM